MRVLSLVTNSDVGIYEQQQRRLREEGVDVTTLSVPGTRSADDGTNRTPADYLRFAGRGLRRSLDSFDLVHANYGLTAPVAVAQLRLPVVVSLWGSDLLGERTWLRRLSRACADRADAVVVMSEEMAAELDRDCHVIPHGVDVERFRPIPRDDARAEVGWDRDARHVLFPYSPEREVKEFPRAERVVDAARERVDARVELQTTTGVPHGRMPFFMNAADAMLLTSRREGSPNTVKEAMACNVPVVSTDVGDVRERLSGVDPSYVCRSDAEFVDGLVDVLSEPRRSDGRAAASELSLERTGERLRRVYERVGR